MGEVVHHGRLLVGLYDVKKKIGHMEGDINSIPFLFIIRLGGYCLALLKRIGRGEGKALR